MKVTDIDHGEWTERRFEPDDPPAGNGKGDSRAEAEIKVECKTVVDAWPMLGAAAYYGLAGKVVNTILPHTEADPAAMLLQYLVSFGNVGDNPTASPTAPSTTRSCTSCSPARRRQGARAPRRSAFAPSSTSPPPTG